MKALQIDFYLGSDLVIQNQIHFDALLMYYAIEEDEDNGIYHDKIENEYHLPIRKIQINNRWFWDCSNSIVKTIRIRKDTIKKRLNIDELKKNNVNIAGTYYGVRMITIERQQVEYVRFFVYGDRDKIEHLVNRMRGRNLGMLRAKGFGVIADIKISEVNMPYCFIHENILLRDLPIDDADIFFYLTSSKSLLKKGRYRPPYYDMVLKDNLKSTLLCGGSVIGEEDKLPIQIL